MLQSVIIMKTLLINGRVKKSTSTPLDIMSIKREDEFAGPYKPYINIHFCVELIKKTVSILKLKCRS